MNVRVHEAKRSAFGKLSAWTIFILSLIGAGAGIAETHVVYTVYALIVAAVAGMYLLAQRSRRVGADGDAAGRPAAER